jgi:hypothetical protein
MLMKATKSSILGDRMMCFILHAEEGLPENTVLCSKERDLCWKIETRRIKDIAASRQKRFANEKEIILSISVQKDSIEDYAESIIEKERTLGFQYIIVPIGHKEMPNDNEELVIRSE